MSIYVVRLSDFHTPDDGKFEQAVELVKMSRCAACDKKLRWKSALARHSFAYCGEDAWCSEKCLKSGKIAKVDKRRERRFFRKLKLHRYFGE